MKSLITRFVNDESGATAIEYGLIAAFVSLAVIAGFTTIKADLTEIFTKINTAVTANK